MKHLFWGLAFALFCHPVLAQGVKDPSTPNSVIIVNPPQQPSRPTAVPNIPPSQAGVPPLGVRRAYRYRNYRGHR